MTVQKKHIFTTSQINEATSKAVALFNGEIIDMVKGDLFYIRNNCDVKNAAKMMLYTYGLTKWGQKSNGDTTGYTNWWTNEELYNVINDINKIYKKALTLQ